MSFISNNTLFTFSQLIFLVFLILVGLFCIKINKKDLVTPFKIFSMITLRHNKYFLWPIILYIIYLFIKLLLTYVTFFSTWFFFILFFWSSLYIWATVHCKFPSIFFWFFCRIFISLIIFYYYLVFFIMTYFYFTIDESSEFLLDVRQTKITWFSLCQLLLFSYILCIVHHIVLLIGAIAFTKKKKWHSIITLQKCRLAFRGMLDLMKKSLVYLYSLTKDWFVFGSPYIKYKIIADIYGPLVTENTFFTKIYKYQYNEEFSKYSDDFTKLKSLSRCYRQEPVPLKLIPTNFIIYTSFILLIVFISIFYAIQIFFLIIINLFVIFL